jgi:hypothetical protein
VTGGTLDSAVGTIGPVEIRVPADPGIIRVVRLAVSGVAAMATFSVDEIEDAKLAVSEMLIVLIEQGSAESVDVQVEVDGPDLVLVGSTTAELDDADADLALSRAVLDSVCAEHSIDAHDGRVRIRAVVRHLDIDGE